MTNTIEPTELEEQTLYDTDQPAQTQLRPRARPPAPGLHLVATPIGDLRDVSIRALDVLAGAAAIACEDTRVTRRLLQAYGLRTPLVSYHDHNGEERRPELLRRLAAGEAVALCSDAGTPLVSDPGWKLARAALDAGHPVHVAPGANAALAALLLSGLPSDAFFFAGFLDRKAGPRRARLEQLSRVPGALIFYEAPQRVGETLADMAEILGPRPAALAREITKLYEETVRETLPELARRYAETPPRGEIVLVVGPPLADAATDAADLDALLREGLRSLSVRDAADAAAKAAGVSKRDAYRRALALAGEG